jgi:hypothetical protein
MQPTAQVSTTIGCNTTAEVVLLLSFTYTDQTLLSGNQGPQILYTTPLGPWPPGDAPNLTQALNITEVIGVYTTLLLTLFENIVSGDFIAGPTYPITFSYTMSDEYSTVSVTNSTTVVELIAVNFLSTGKLLNYTFNPGLDLNSTEINSLIGLVLPDNENFWTLFNWMFGVWFWLAMYDFGQLSSLSDDNTYITESNIFTNNTLLQNFTSIANELIIGSGVTGLLLSQPPLTALSLNATNELEPVLTPLRQTYTCTQRQLKGGLTVTISIIVADYALALGAYNLFILLAGWWQEWKDKAGIPQEVVLGNCNSRTKENRGCERSRGRRDPDNL